MDRHLSVPQPPATPESGRGRTAREDRHERVDLTQKRYFGTPRDMSLSGFCCAAGVRELKDSNDPQSTGTLRSVFQNTSSKLLMLITDQQEHTIHCIVIAKGEVR